MSQKVDISVTQSRSIAALHGKPHNHEATDANETLILMAHNFPGHKNDNNDLYGDLEFLLVDQGFHTLRFDFYGCGQSEGSDRAFSVQRSQEDFTSALVWASRQGYKRFIYIGEGLGATLAVMNMNRGVGALILLWPVFDPASYAQGLMKRSVLKSDGLCDYYVQGDHKIGVDFIHDLQELDIIPNLQKIKVPTLVMHGSQDEIVPVSQLQVAREHLKSDRIEITAFFDGVHGLQELKHRKMMFYHIGQFIEKNA